MTTKALKVIREDAEQEFQKVAFAEVLVPNEVNVFGDIHTPEGVREFAYKFMMAGIGTNVGIDINHDNVDVYGEVYVVESFIAREDDKEFIPGSWVVGIFVESDIIWQKILDGELNGFSYEALVNFQPVLVEVPDNDTVTGMTEADVYDGHTHAFVVILDNDGRVVEGSTSFDHGHSHDITEHSVTKESSSHKHRFNVITVNYNE